MKRYDPQNWAEKCLTFLRLNTGQPSNNNPPEIRDIILSFMLTIAIFADLVFGWLYQMPGLYLAGAVTFVILSYHLFKIFPEPEYTENEIFTKKGRPKEEIDVDFDREKDEKKHVNRIPDFNFG